MWMMGYNDGGDLYMADSFNGRKFRPLVPKPISSTTPNGGGNVPGITSQSPPCLSRLHGGADVFSLNPNHIGMMSDQSKRDFDLQHQVVVSSRWNPTPEQLRTLEELYRRGTRTPSADQIQHITAQLRRYGKIEGKNVFYWFQNHKARERQKRRRQMDSDDHQSTHGSGQREIETLGRKDTESAEGESNKTLPGVDHHHHHHHHHTNKNANNSNNWAPPMNCSALPEESATSAMQKTAKAGGGGIECKSSSSSLEHRHRWMKIFGNGESQCRRSAADPWPMMQHHQLSCPPPTHLINTTTMVPKLAGNKKFPNKPHPTSFLIAPPPPHEEIFINSRLLNTSEGDDQEEEEEDDDDENSQTLQLFPLRSGDGYAANGKEDTEMSVSAINGFVAHPHQFFEFLPVKNQ